LKTILLIEDEVAIADTVIYALETEGFEVVWCQLGKEGLNTLRTRGPIALVILDVGLPDGNGFEVCKTIRHFSNVPIIFLTAHNEEVDRIVGLEIGADDYVSKPFSPRELAARVKTILKRALLPDSNTEIDARFDLNADKAQIHYCGQLLDLTPWLICSLIHKFGRSEDAATDDFVEELRNSLPKDFSAKGELFVFVDECHRTQYGKLNETEGAKFWLSVVTELKNRGVQDIFIACVDGLKGFPEAIEAVFPKTVVQLCIVHMVRHSLNFVSWKNRKAVATDLKRIYQAASAEEAEQQLDAFAETWDGAYIAISQSWRRNWARIIPFFAYPAEIRKVIYTTNAIESINMSLRKVTKNRGSFPNDEAIVKLFFLALRNIAKKWTMPIRDWKAALNRFTILFEGRMPMR